MKNSILGRVTLPSICVNATARAADAPAKALALPETPLRLVNWSGAADAES
jgi:hypothetical protein